jgi:hypothetical protein
MSKKIFMNDFRAVINETRHKLQIAASSSTTFQALSIDAILEDLVAIAARKVARSLEGLWPLGFSQTRILPGSTATLTARPQTPWQGLRLVIPIPYFETKYCEIVDIRVGKNSCFLTNVPIDALSFAELPEVSRFCNLKMPPVYAAMDVSIVVCNTGPSPVMFGATMFGRLLDGIADDTEDEAQAVGMAVPSSLIEKTRTFVPEALPVLNGSKLCYACSKPRSDGVLLCLECLKND